MSFDISVSAYCDGKACTNRICDGDYVYCSDCGGQHIEQAVVPAIRDWMDDNALNISHEQRAFLELVAESMDAGLPLVHVRAVAA